nr:uncharacterized protein LOC105746200 [Dasypus novemcinctus]
MRLSRSTLSSGREANRRFISSTGPGSPQGIFGAREPHFRVWVAHALGRAAGGSRAPRRWLRSERPQVDDQVLSTRALCFLAAVKRRLSCESNSDQQQAWMALRPPRPRPARCPSALQPHRSLRPGAQKRPRSGGVEPSCRTGQDRAQIPHRARSRGAAARVRREPGCASGGERRRPPKSSFPTGRTLCPWSRRGQGKVAVKQAPIFNVYLFLNCMPEPHKFILAPLPPKTTTAPTCAATGRGGEQVAPGAGDAQPPWPRGGPDPSGGTASAGPAAGWPVL